MKDYYSLFVELSLQQCAKNDYKDKSKVNAHNIAFTKLERLKRKIREGQNEDILLKLLSHEDNRVKINAASLCLQMNVFLEQSVTVLKKIITDSDDSTICFAAKMILKEQDKTGDSSKT